MFGYNSRRLEEYVVETISGKNFLRLKNIGVSLQRQHNFENQSCKQARHIQFMPHFLKIMVGDGAYLHVTDLPEER